MGEERAALENVACDNPADTVFSIDNHPHVAPRIVCLHSSFGDKLICVHSDAFGYIAFKNKRNNGEMSVVA